MELGISLLIVIEILCFGNESRMKFSHAHPVFAQ